MKNANMIIETIFRQKQYRPLSSYGCYGKFLNLIPPRFKRAISFIFVKENKLFIALSHPGYKMELNYNKDTIKSLLTPFIMQNPQCEFMKVSQVVVFESKYSISASNESQVEDTIPRYSELSSGDFEIDIEDEVLREKFERIREIISGSRR